MKIKIIIVLFIAFYFSAILGALIIPVNAQEAANPTEEPLSCIEDIWSCGEWEECIDNVQTRICTITEECLEVDTPSPEISRSCFIEPLCIEDTWECSEWTTCSELGIQTRSCNLVVDCSGEYTSYPEDVQSCTPPTEEQNFAGCGTNAFETISGSCECQDGYVWASDDPYDLDCIVEEQDPIECGINSVQTEGGSCECQEGYVWASDDPYDLNCIIDLVFEPIAADPVIESISPDVLIPGETIVTIKGSGFGDSYSSFNNQICFGTSCILDFYVDTYLQSWSDTEIIIKVPNFVTETQGAIGIKLYKSTLGYYDYVDSPYYTVKAKPIVYWYYPIMDQGEIYTFTGESFGQSPGKVVINNVEAEVIIWSNTDITFKVPFNVSSGEMFIQTSQGVNSQYISVEILKKYSNDEYSKYQWYLEMLNIDKAWKLTEGSDDVVVAVIDSGVDIYNEDLKHAIWENDGEIANNGIDDDKNGYIDDLYGWDFVLNSNSTDLNSDHGTMVASVIAAKKDNGVGIAGVAPNVKIMPLNASELDDGTYIDLDAAVLAIKYAVDNGADIINLSFGGYSSAMFYEDILQYAYENNVLVIAAVGNDNTNLNFDRYSPACVDLNHNAVIGVAAVNDYNEKSSFSNYGTSCVDLSAPGEYIVVPTLFSIFGDSYTPINGTSFSAPIVTGIAALIKSKNPTWNIEEIKKVLLDTAKDIDVSNPYYINQLGNGLPDAYLAIKAQKPDVLYDYNPGGKVVIKETGIKIEIELPEIQPIEEPKSIENEPVEEETIEKTITGSSFPDIKGHKNENAILYLKNAGVINGYPDGTYKPDKLLNRAELLKILMEANYDESDFDDYDTVSCFDDVPANQWFTKYICAAKVAGIIEGYSDNTFRPANNINLVEALKMTLKTFGYSYAPSTPWYKNIVEEASDRNFIPLDFIAFDNDVNRGQMADMITRMLIYAVGGNDLDEYLGQKADYKVTYESLLNNDYVEGQVNFSGAVDNTNPSDVEEVSVIALDNGKVRVQWEAATDNVGVAGYVVHYGKESITDAGQEYELSKDVGNVLQYTFSGLEAGKKYYFSVVAYDAAENESAYWAPEVSVIVKIPN